MAENNHKELSEEIVADLGRLEHIIARINRNTLILAERLEEHERQGGTINMERSWKTKYRRALEEANRRLIDNDLEPVRIRRHRKHRTTAGNGGRRHEG